MKPIYINDQTKEFEESPKVITILGELTLNGGPYTNPKEAVDKKYVDEAFGEININDVSAEMPASKYPAFNNHLINKAGENNFILENVVTAATDYHTLRVDAYGRVIGGNRGKLDLTTGIFDEIPFDKIIIPGGTDPSFIIPTFDPDNYLTLKGDNIITGDVTIDVPGKFDRLDDEEVINLSETMEVSERYFRGSIGGLYRSGVEKIGVVITDVERYRYASREPWLKQWNFTPYDPNPINPTASEIIDILPFWDRGSIRNPRTFITNGELHLYNLSYDDWDEEKGFEPEKYKNFKIPLDEHGVIPPDFEAILTHIPPIPGFGGVDGTPSLDQRPQRVFAFGETLMMFPANNVSGWKEVTYNFDHETGTFGELFDVNGTTNDCTRMYTNKSINVRDWRATSVYADRDPKTGKVIGKSKNLPVSINCSAFDEFQGGYDYFILGPYLYGFFQIAFGYGFSANSNRGIVSNKLKRISLNNGIPFGRWEDVSVPNAYRSSGANYTSVMTINKMVIIPNVVVDAGKSRVNITYLNVDDSGNLTFHDRIVLSEPVDTYSPWYALSKGRLFVIDRTSISCYPFKGTTSDYRFEIDDLPEDLRDLKIK